MALPFTSTQFFGVFGAYNEAVWQGAVGRHLRFRLACSTRVAAGVALVMFAPVIYPAWSVYSGHGYPAMPKFGLPCPTALFTIGLLAFLVPPYPRSTLVVPVLWCLVGAQAAFLLGVWQDLGLLVAAVVGAALAVQSSVHAGRVLP